MADKIKAIGIFAFLIISFILAILQPNLFLK